MGLTGASPRFRHEVIDADPPCGKLGFCLTEDLTGNGRPDVAGKSCGTNHHVDVWYNEG